MNVSGNGRMDWFFKEWVYGTDLPSYAFEYSLSDGEGGKTQATFKVTQQDVPKTFVMPVPVYAEIDGHPVKLGAIPMQGSMTSNEIKINLPKRPTRLMINANNDILASSVSQK
jgi:hypothetical protein